MQRELEGGIIKSSPIGRMYPPAPPDSRLEHPGDSPAPRQQNLRFNPPRSQDDLLPLRQYNCR